MSSSEIGTDSSTTVVSSEPDAVVQYAERFVESALYSVIIQAVSCGWVQKPLHFRGDITSIFASFSAGCSGTAGIPALKLDQLTFTKGPRGLSTGWFPPHRWRSKAWWRHKAAYYLWVRASADAVSASTQKPELCISTGAKVNLGFGALLILEMSVSVHGKSMSE